MNKSRKSVIRKEVRNGKNCKSEKVLEDIRKDVNEYRLVLIGMAKFEQGIRWINAVCIDRLDKALSRAEFKSL